MYVPSYSDIIVVKYDMGRPIVILLEHDGFSIDAIRRILAFGDYDCVEAHSETEVLACYRSHSASVVALISELELPGCVGTDVAVKMAEVRPGLPILFVTATPWEAWPVIEQQKLSGLPAGTVSFLDKPFRASSLLAKLSEFLEKRSAGIGA